MTTHILNSCINLIHCHISFCVEEEVTDLRWLLHCLCDKCTVHMEYQMPHFKAALDVADGNDSSIWEYFYSVPKTYLRDEVKW